MSTLLYTQRGPTPPDEANARTTITVVQADAPPSVEEKSPTFNSATTDQVTEGGLTSHQLASKVTDSHQKPAPAGNANESAALFGRVNEGQSTRGRAPGLEAAGRWGHGSLLITEGIEPVLEDGHAFSETYFSAGNRPIQSTADHAMSAAEPSDSATRAAGQATATAASRAAVSASQYAAFYEAVTH